MKRVLIDDAKSTLRTMNLEDRIETLESERETTSEAASVAEPDGKGKDEDDELQAEEYR